MTRKAKFAPVHKVEGTNRHKAINIHVQQTNFPAFPTAVPVYINKRGSVHFKPTKNPENPRTAHEKKGARPNKVFLHN